MTAAFSMKWKSSGKGESDQWSEGQMNVARKTRSWACRVQPAQWFSTKVQGPEYSFARCTLHRTPPRPVLPPSYQGIGDRWYPTFIPLTKPCNLASRPFSFAQRCYPIAKPCSLGTAALRGAGRNLFLILTKIPHTLTATLAKCFPVAYHAFTLHVLPVKALHHNQSLSGRNSEKMITVITMLKTIPHFGFALNICEGALV